jgi:hypothetical protein
VSPIAEDEARECHDLTARVGANEVDKERQSYVGDGCRASFALTEDRSASLSEQPNEEHWSDGQGCAEPPVDIRQIAGNGVVHQGVEQCQCYDDAETGEAIGPVRSEINGNGNPSQDRTYYQP